MMSPLERLVCALREELEQYGEMLALLDYQEQLLPNGSDEVLRSITLINGQIPVLQDARRRREESQRSVATDIHQPADSSFCLLIPLLPEPYKLLVSALVQENNELLQRVRCKAEQNQVMLKRSLEMLGTFLTTLAEEPTPWPLEQNEEAACLAMAGNL